METEKTRKQLFEKMYPGAPTFRKKQIDEAIFHFGWNGWNDASIFPKEMREKMNEKIPWEVYKKSEIFESKTHDTYKAALELLDGAKIETVLMANPENKWTLCASSQVGCGMGCVFCATGKMGFVRNLTDDEIIDQYRFWKEFLLKKKGPKHAISNMVIMGMGEPILNYENVKNAINAILQYTKIGQTNITVSTIGVFPALERILEDASWPRVRMAISLHSADPDARKKIIPSSPDDFIQKIAAWSKKYLKKFGNRQHYLTYEYIMLQGMNDGLPDAKKLANLVTTTGKIKVNLIPHNETGLGYKKSADTTTQQFLQYLKKHHVLATVRQPRGEDICAACGQLVS